MCKIKDLDRNEVYDLTEIKKDIAKFDLLNEWLKDNDQGWDHISFDPKRMNNKLYYSNKLEEWRLCNDKPVTKCALTLFELDITDYQVDCSELSKEQISNLCNIFEVKGYKLSSIQSALDVKGSFVYFRVPEDNNKVYGVFDYYEGQTVITYEKFIELFWEKAVELSETNHSEDAQKYALSTEQGYKESDNKCNYELDFDFIRDLAMRIQNEPKYEPYNWQKPMNVEQLSSAMLRHAIEVKKGNFDDKGELGHLLAIAANAMFIYYQKKNNE